MKTPEEMLREQEKEYEKLLENSISDFYAIEEARRNMDDEATEEKVRGRSKKVKNKQDGRNPTSVYMYYDVAKWRNFTFLGIKVNLRLFKTHTSIPKDRMARLDAVCKNITTKTLYRYLIELYKEEELTPTLDDVDITDCMSFMRAINMANAILKINYVGDIWLMGNFKNKKYSFCIAFPNGTFVRKKQGQERYDSKYNKDRPQYTYLELYEGIDGFDVDDCIQ